MSPTASVMRQPQNYRNRLFILAFLAAQLTVLVAAAEPSVVTVKGTGEQAVAMDRALTSLVITESGNDVALLERAAATRVNQLLAMTDSLDIARKHVDSTGIRVMPRSRFDPQRKQHIDDGYTVERTVRIDLHDLEQLGRLMNEVAKLGVDRVNSPSLYASTHETAYQAALANAVAQATSSANTIANTLGRQLGNVLSVEEGHTQRSPVIPMARMVAAREADTGAFNAAEGNISATVIMTFELQFDRTSTLGN